MVGRLHDEIQKYDLLGFRPAEVAEKAAQLDSLVDAMQRKIAELEDFGVQVKDLDLGLVDFPAEWYGVSVMLCWRYGVADVSFWHTSNEGINRRKSLKLQIVQP